MPKNPFENPSQKEIESPKRNEAMRARVVELLKLSPDIGWPDIDRMALNDLEMQDWIRTCCALDIPFTEIREEFAEHELKRLAKIERHNHSSVEGVESFNTKLIECLNPELLQRLHNITTEAEADASEERKKATESRNALTTELDELHRTTDLTDDAYLELHDRLQEFKRAIGTINRRMGMIDHSR